MRTTIVAIVVIATLAITFNAAIKTRKDIRHMTMQIASLEREIRHRQAMLDDMAHVVQHMRHPTYCIDTGMDVHSAIYALADRLERSGHPVVVEVAGNE